MRFDHDRADQICGYNEVIEQLYQQYEKEFSQDPNALWGIRTILNHQGPLTANDPNWKGSKWNILIEWENGETTYEPLKFIARNDPVTCALYAKQKNLLDTESWKQLKRWA